MGRTQRPRVIVATTDAIPAYGGFKLDRQSLEVIANSLRTGQMPMHFEHDISQPVVAKDVDAGVEERSDGEFVVWAEFDVDADQWDAYLARLDAIGAPGGMSFSFMQRIVGADSALARVVLAGDASHFSEKEIVEAARRLRQLDPAVSAQFLYQFSYVPPVKVLIELAWSAISAILPNIVSSILYDAGKSLIRPNRATIFNVVVTDSPRGKKKLKVHIASDSVEAFEVAMNRLPSVLNEAASGTFAYRPSIGVYEQIESVSEPAAAMRLPQEPGATDIGSQESSE